jgi:hypothetical protein
MLHSYYSLFKLSLEGRHLCLTMLEFWKGWIVGSTLTIAGGISSFGIYYSNICEVPSITIKFSDSIIAQTLIAHDKLPRAILDAALKKAADEILTGVNKGKPVVVTIPIRGRAASMHPEPQ